MRHDKSVETVPCLLCALEWGGFGCLAAVKTHKSWPARVVRERQTRTASAQPRFLVPYVLIRAALSVTRVARWLGVRKSVADSCEIQRDDLRRAWLLLAERGEQAHASVLCHGSPRSCLWARLMGAQLFKL